jgi:hypothetical protein
MIRGKKMNPSSLRTGVLAPLAALAVLAAAPAQAHTGGGGQAAAPASSSAAVAMPVASGGPVMLDPAAPPDRTRPAATGLDLGVSRVVRRCEATVRRALRQAPAIVAGGTHAATAAHRNGIPERPPADLRARRAVPGAASKQVGGVRHALTGRTKAATTAATRVGEQAVVVVPRASLEAAPPVGPAHGIVADCPLSGTEPVRRLTGPVSGTLFVGSPGPAGMIPERRLS